MTRLDVSCTLGNGHQSREYPREWQDAAYAVAHTFPRIWARRDGRSRSKAAKLVDMLCFYRRLGGEWHGLASDPLTRMLSEALAGKGLIQVNWYGQGRAVQPDGSPWA